MIRRPGQQKSGVSGEMGSELFDRCINVMRILLKVNLNDMFFKSLFSRESLSSTTTELSV